MLVQLRMCSNYRNLVVISFNRIDTGKTVTLTYRDITVKSGAGASDGDTAPADGVPDVSEFGVTTTVGTDADAVNAELTTLTGGTVHAIPGSGEIAITSPSDASVRAGRSLSKLVITYTADAAITGQTLVIAVPAGLQADEPISGDGTTDSEYVYDLGTDSTKAGYVSSPDSDDLPAGVAVDTDAISTALYYLQCTLVTSREYC